MLEVTSLSASGQQEAPFVDQHSTRRRGSMHRLGGVLGVPAAVADASPQDRERPEDRLLDSGRWARKPYLVAVLPQDHGHAEKVRQTLAVGLAVFRKSEERLEEHL